MNIPMVDSENWYGLNEKVKTILLEKNLCEADDQIRIYDQVSTAIYESVVGMAHFYSHKRKVAWVKGVHPYLKAVSPYFYKETYEILELNYQQSFEDAVSTLNKEYALVFSCEDHLITGEIFPFSVLQAKTDDLKTINVRLSFNYFKFQDKISSPYTVRICVLSSNLAVVICGSRFKAVPHIGETQRLNESAILKTIESELSNRRQFLSEIEEFESKLPTGYLPFFPSTNKSRVYDRSVIYSTELNADAVVKYLAASLALQPNQISTTSDCYWGSRDVMKNWQIPALSPVQERGLLVIDRSVLERSAELIKSLELAKAECQI